MSMFTSVMLGGSNEQITPNDSVRAYQNMWVVVKFGNAGRHAATMIMQANECGKMHKTNDMKQ